MVLETVGNLMTLSVSVAFVATRNTLAAGFAGLVISYTLNVTQGLSWFVRMATEFETNVVSVEKIREYSELTIEVSHSLPYSTMQCCLVLASVKFFFPPSSVF